MRRGMKRTLIVNADDLGYTRGVNGAIARCCTGGTVRSATLMANGPAFGDALAVIKRGDIRNVGIHLALTELMPVSRPDEVPGLIDEHGFMPSGPGGLLVLLQSGKVGTAALRKELERQVEKVLDHGLVPTHVDSHKHVHILPQVLDVTLEIAQKYSIPWIRCPFDGTPARRIAPLVERHHRVTFWKQHFKVVLSRIWRPAFMRRVRRSNMRTVDHFCGVSLTGIWNELMVRRMVEQLPPGLNEWMIHPGACDRDLRQSQTRLLEQREKERDIFCSDALRELFAKHDVMLAGYGEIVT
jgi:chitin disaccharide deacetylase